MMSWDGPGRLDRAEDRRGDEDWVAGQWAAPGARVLSVTGQGRVGWAGGALDYHPPAGPPTEAHLLLGRVDGQPVFVELVPDLAGGQTLRAVMETLDETDLEVAFGAAALADWHDRDRFCGTCGAPTRVIRAGLSRSCPGCGRESYPRVDPAVIVAVTDPDDRLLLGRQASWPAGRVSVFAGFVEAGESLEQTVHREVFEEVGVRLSDLAYLGSQPWPFPRSLMVGFAARTADPTLALDTTEIEQANWFSRDELTAALASGQVALPMTTSIAHRMISAWRAGGSGEVDQAPGGADHH